MTHVDKRFDLADKLEKERLDAVEKAQKERLDAVGKAQKERLDAVHLSLDELKLDVRALHSRRWW